MLNYTFLIFLVSLVYCHEDISDYEVEEPEVFLDEDCIRKTLATAEDVINLKSFQLPTSRTGRCLLACMYKKISIMTPEGKYSIEGGLVAIKRALNPYPKALDGVSNIVNECAVAVGNIDDDYEGCEIAAALFTCVVNNFSEYWQPDISDSDSDSTES